MRTGGPGDREVLEKIGLGWINKGQSQMQLETHGCKHEGYQRTFRLFLDWADHG